MAKTVKVNENFTLNYSSREDNSGDTVMDCAINFDNPRDDSVIIHRLNTWLQAIGRSDIVVQPKEYSKGAK
ncbi:MAG: hypothetical protein EBT86_09420 [Actinobacteria bacterium]|nr:hypothetical protein [Actinomycetota bacterium]